MFRFMSILTVLLCGVQVEGSGSALPTRGWLGSDGTIWVSRNKGDSLNSGFEKQRTYRRATGWIGDSWQKAIQTGIVQKCQGIELYVRSTTNSSSSQKYKLIYTYNTQTLAWKPSQDQNEMLTLNENGYRTFGARKNENWADFIPEYFIRIVFNTEISATGYTAKQVLVASRISDDKNKQLDDLKTEMPKLNIKIDGLEDASTTTEPTQS